MMQYYKIIRLLNIEKKKEFCNLGEYIMGRLDVFVCNYSGVVEQNVLELWDRFFFYDWFIKLNQFDLILE